MRTRGLSVVITAGYAASPAAIALVQLLLRGDVRVSGIMIVTPFQLARAKALLQARGFKAFKSLALRALGATQAHAGEAYDPIENFFASEGLKRIALPALAGQSGIPCKTFRSLNSPEAISFLRTHNPTGVAYCGGGILRKPFLSAVEGKVLNAHAGPLPRVRGMNATEWSILLGLPLEVTIHFIDAGVDTGPVLARLPIALTPGDTLDTLRSKAVVNGVRGLHRNIQALAAPLPPKAPDRAQFVQAFVLAPAMRDLAEWRLAQCLRTAETGSNAAAAKEAAADAW
jgi:hypothetical protein